jgi:ribosome-binding factor A
VKHQTYKRADRVGEEIRKTIAHMLIEGDLRDARLQACTITAVEMADDLREGKVFFSLLGNPGVREEALHAFNRAAGFVRTEVARRLELRYAPALRFYFDPSMERAARLSELIKEARERDEAARREKEKEDADE